MGPTSIPKSMKNRYTFHARKGDAKNIEKHKNGADKEVEIKKKTIKNTYKKRSKNRGFAQLVPGGPGVPGELLINKIN